LLDVKRAYIHKQQLRNAITNIANAIFGTRLKHIWGEGTAACATEF
jgi:TnpA family transposase